MFRRSFWHVALALAVVGLGSVLSLNAQLPGVPYNFTADSTLNWMVGGTVNVVERAGNTVFIGGEFRALAPKKNLTGGFALLSAAGSRRALLSPFVNGEVSAVLFDPTSGSWFVAGRFGRVGTTLKDHIVRLGANGNIDQAFTARVVGRVRTLTIGNLGGTIGRVLYVGGEFAQAGVGASLQSVQNLAAFTVPFVTGTPALVTGFTPAPNLPVHALAAINPSTGATTTLYVGGEFTSIGGQSRNNLAAVDPATGTATTWNPNPDGRVLTIAPTADGLTLFVGGDFNAIGPDTRGFAAAISAASGAATIWNPQPNGQVRSLLISGSNIYAGGNFTLIGGLARERLALLNTTDGAAVSAFDVPANGAVHALALNSTTLYAGGEFTNIGGKVRLHIAAVNAGTGAVADWNPSFNDTVRSIAIASGVTVGIGGDFDAFGAIPRRNLAAVSLETGEVLPWRPVPNGTVRALEIAGGLLYVGGEFTKIDQADRNRLAAFGRPGLQLASWNPNADAPVHIIEARGSTIYAGGDFTTVGGQTRERIAALNATSGVPTSWAPTGGNGRVLTIDATSTFIYAGGQFTTLGGLAVNRLTRLDPSTGVADAIWNPNPDGEIRGIEADGATIYVAGAFGTIGGQTRTNLAAVDGTTGAASGWEPNPNGPVNSIDQDGTTLYAGGNFLLISPGRPSVRRRPRLVGLDTTATGPDAVYVTSFAPRWVGQVNDVDFDDDGILAGGDALFEGEEDEPVSRVSFFPRLFNLPPYPPTEIGATVFGAPSFATVTLRWGPPILGARPDRFILEAGTTPGGTQITGGANAGSANLVTFANVPAGTYYVRVRSQNARGTSAPSADVALTVGSSCAAPIDPPSDLTVQVSGSQLTLSWTPASGGTIGSYRIEAGLAPGSSMFIVPVNATETSFTASVPAGVYYARVRALATCGDSVASNEVQIVVGAQGPPGPPLDVESTTTGSTVTITWTAPGGQTSYILEAGSAPGLSNIAVAPLGNVTTVTAQNVPPGTYFVRLRAVNAAGVSTTSDEILVIVP